jgi:hypothetical protein
MSQKNCIDTLAHQQCFFFFFFFGAKYALQETLQYYYKNLN